MGLKDDNRTGSTAVPYYRIIGTEYDTGGLRPVLAPLLSVFSTGTSLYATEYSIDGVITVRMGSGRSNSVRSDYVNRHKLTIFRWNDRVMICPSRNLTSDGLISARK